MRSRKKKAARQTAESAAGKHAPAEQTGLQSSQPVQSDAFAPDVDAMDDVAAVAAESAPASVPDVTSHSDPSPAAMEESPGALPAESLAEHEDVDASSFDASVDGPDAQLEADADAALDPKALLAKLRQRVLDSPSDVASRLRLGALHDKRSEPLLALEQYQAAVAADSENSTVVLHLAQSLTNLNRFAEAERELRRVLKAEPDNGLLHLQLGTISFRRGLYSQAEVELKRAIELLPDAAMAYFHRGESLNQLSRLDEALEMLERGVALDPTYSRAYYIMGILYDRKSRPQEAGAMYKKAREVAGT